MTSCDIPLVFLSAADIEKKYSAIHIFIRDVCSRSNSKRKKRNSKGTYSLKVVCIVYFFGHKAVHICWELILKQKKGEPSHYKPSHLHHLADTAAWHRGPFVSDKRSRSINQKETKKRELEEGTMLKWLWPMTHPTNLHPIGRLLHLLSERLGLGARLQRARVTGWLGRLLKSMSGRRRKKKKETESRSLWWTRRAWNLQREEFLNAEAASPGSSRIHVQDQFSQVLPLFLNVGNVHLQRNDGRVIFQVLNRNVTPQFCSIAVTKDALLQTIALLGKKCIFSAAVKQSGKKLELHQPSSLLCPFYFAIRSLTQSQ